MTKPKNKKTNKTKNQKKKKKTKHEFPTPNLEYSLNDLDDLPN